MLRGRLCQLTRQFSTTVARRSADDYAGVVGTSLPLDPNKRLKMLATFILFFGSGLTAPMLIIRHQLSKST